MHPGALTDLLASNPPQESADSETNGFAAGFIQQPDRAKTHSVTGGSLWQSTEPERPKQPGVQHGELWDAGRTHRGGRGRSEAPAPN